MQANDPIEALRSEFELIEPSPVQLQQWQMRVRGVDRTHTVTRIVAQEPVPWRLVTGLAAAAAIALSMVSVLAMRAPAEHQPIANQPGEMMHDLIVRLDADDAASPPPARQPQMEFHMPATGFDHLRMQVEDVRRAIGAALFAGDQQRGT